MSSAIEYLLKVQSEDLTMYSRETGSWTGNEKLEYDLDVDSAEKTLNFGDIDKIRFFLIYTDTPISVNFVQGADAVTFEIQDLLVFTPTVDFINALTGITIWSLGGVANVKIRVYGEAQ